MLLALSWLPARPGVALELGNEELAAAREVTCILAQDALGFLDADAFNALLDGALEDFDIPQGDVIYAKALGYFDGLMFGLPDDNERLINDRLRSFNSSGACNRLVTGTVRI